MDPTMAALAGVASTALVQAVTRDTWETAKARLAKIFNRHRGEDDPDLAGQLDVTERHLRAAAGSPGSAAEERRRWAAMLGAFLSGHGEAAPELREFVDEARKATARDTFTVVQQINAGRDSYTSARDLHVTPRPAVPRDPDEA
ncbi:hypothetical protein Skr01_63750 [Sphaerisporangium krabiense]|uniref:Uncharacterized protein n=1 Tax=Sphaerisporangium krabiense TaxID=763782 RepID=A0A7W8Z6C2_9ACTN|nr:hypothetical protein [Sphaerisporangium krabiense]MBB5628293.1 hypothetical protein [Sphaerisporangium krabiense]GII66290.1 hypothetical protein Skr01_63750 [Sphaerisporangium krabiense]